MEALYNFVPFIAIGLVMYFLIIKPQVDEKKAHDALLASLAKDDKVVTNGGVWGRVVEVRDAQVVLDLGSKMKITVDKRAVARRAEDSASQKQK